MIGRIHVVEILGFLAIAAALFAMDMGSRTPTSPPPKYVTATPGAPHVVCLKLEEQVIPDTCRTVYGQATVSVRIITATP